MSEINEEEIIAGAKKTVDAILNSAEKIDTSFVKYYYNDPSYRHVGLFFGQTSVTNYEQFSGLIEGAYSGLKEVKFTDKKEYYKVLSPTVVLYDLVGEVKQVTKEGQEMEFLNVATLILSLIDGEWKVIHETEAAITKPKEE